MEAFFLYPQSHRLKLTFPQKKKSKIISVDSHRLRSIFPQEKKLKLVLYIPTEKNSYSHRLNFILSLQFIEDHFISIATIFEGGHYFVRSAGDPEHLAYLFEGDVFDSP